MKRKLTFPHTKLKLLLADAEKRWPEEVRGGADYLPNQPGFWLVGDSGVYIMHNGAYHDDKVIVYAKECDPSTMDFDDWWESKRNTFGGDDGVIFIEKKIMKDIVDDGGNLVAVFAADNVQISWGKAR